MTNEPTKPKPESDKPNAEWLSQLLTKRNSARQIVINKLTDLKPKQTAYYDAKAAYDDAVIEYEALDKEYAVALFKQNKRKNRKKAASKPYNANKVTAKKAIKALKNLPADLRAKILKDVAEGLF